VVARAVLDALLLRRESVLVSSDGGAGMPASRTLRRDRELAFYGAEDFTPSAFYKRDDAVVARDAARMVVKTVRPYIA